MAKNNLSAEILEAVLVKVLDKFTDTIQTIVSQFSTAITTIVSGRLDEFSLRMKSIEDQLARLQEKPNSNSQSLATSNINLGDSDTSSHNAVDIAKRAIMEYEMEKDELQRRSRNLVITGLPPSLQLSDTDLIESFCENNLTVKPRIVRTWRLGKDRTSINSKLCVTLENADAVEDLLSSSALLRQSIDQKTKTVYFNRDLTKQQAAAAYKLRCERRTSQHTSTIGSSSFPINR
jgi:hypothetical protein